MMAKYAIFPPFPGVFLCARHKRMDKYPPHHPKTSQRKNAQEDKAQCVASGEISDNPQDEGREEATQATRGPDQAGDRARLGGEIKGDEFEHGAIAQPHEGGTPQRAQGKEIVRRTLSDTHRRTCEHINNLQKPKWRSLIQRCKSERRRLNKAVPSRAFSNDLVIVP